MALVSAQGDQRSEHKLEQAVRGDGVGHDANQGVLGDANRARIVGAKEKHDHAKHQNRMARRRDAGRQRGACGAFELFLKRAGT